MILASAHGQYPIHVFDGITSAFDMPRALGKRAGLVTAAICLAAILASDVQSVDAVPKFIGLLRAGDPVVLTPSIREGAFVTEALHDYSSKLQRAVGL